MKLERVWMRNLIKYLFNECLLYKHLYISFFYNFKDSVIKLLYKCIQISKLPIEEPVAQGKTLGTIGINQASMSPIEG